MAKPDYTKIFIVEDDAAYARTVRHALEQKNYLNLKVFSNGHDCLAHLKQRPEIIILDYDLGDKSMDGMEVLRYIKRNHPQIQVLFLTALDNLEVATNTIKEGAYDYVVKTEAALERTKNIIRRIVFENHIQNENRILKRSQRVIIGIIIFLGLGIILLSLIQFIN